MAKVELTGMENLIAEVEKLGVQGSRIENRAQGSGGGGGPGGAIEKKPLKEPEP